MPEIYYTGMKIRCPHCHRYFGAPDLESVKTYAAQGGMIQTLTQRIIAQPIIHRYETPAPLWRAVAFASLPAFLAPSAVLYWHVDPSLAGGIAVTCLAVGLVIGSTQVEQVEIEDEPAADDEPEYKQDEPMPARFEEVTIPFKNSMSIRLAHEPPANADPTRQRTLGQADLALAKLATGNGAISPVSFANAKRAGYRFGEPAFYEVQRRWLYEGIAFKSTNGAVYLKPSGIKTLRRYAGQ